MPAGTSPEGFSPSRIGLAAKLFDVLLLLGAIAVYAGARHPRGLRPAEVGEREAAGQRAPQARRVPVARRLKRLPHTGGSVLTTSPTYTPEER